MAFSAQPPELVNHTVSFIPRPRDLLSLALTAKSLHGIIIPQHLEFRVVCCDARRAALWKALAAQPGLASRFHTLEIVTESDSAPADTARIAVPRSIIEAEGDSALAKCTVIQSVGKAVIGCDAGCVDALCAAIPNMSGLTRFCWDHPGFMRLHDPKAIFSAVAQNCVNVRELEVRFHDGNLAFDDVSGPLWRLTNLTRLSITLMSIPMNTSREQRHLAQLLEMLSECPQLQDLRFTYACRRSISLYALFAQGGSWPHLKRLVIDGDIDIASPNRDYSAAKDFLRRHPQLEILSLPYSFELPLPPMPHLRWLLLPEFADKSSGNPTFPLLEHVSMTGIYSSPQTDILSIFTTIRRLPSLNSVAVSFVDPKALDNLSQTFPQIERLSLLKSPWNDDRMLAKSTLLPSEECLAILTSFQALTHLDSSAAVGIDDDLDTVLVPFLKALSAAPRLKYVSFDSYNPKRRRAASRWVTIVRGQYGEYAGWASTKNLDECHVHGPPVTVFRDPVGKAGHAMFLPLGRGPPMSADPADPADIGGRGP
ncbi:hypothetical protein B0H10DRAFT_2229469 [Mycena sp. CBHHK59/15]|nr:hypothetical protein B0H10DRAFT_2229469 [Mycena sp. CBHHK59/15]